MVFHHICISGIIEQLVSATGTSGTLPVFHLVWLGLLSVISYATSFRRVLQDADLQASSQLWWCSITFSSCISGILEQLVTATVDSTRLTSSVACSFRWFKSIGLSGDIWTVQSVLQQSARCGTGGDEQNGAEVIRTSAGNLQQVRQSQYRRATSCVETQGRRCQHFPYLQEAVTRKPSSSRPTFTIFFLVVFWSRFNSSRFIHYVFLYPIYIGYANLYPGRGNGGLEENA